MYATTATYRPEEMEGRSYGTDSSSFLSVDAYVQDPSNAQGFNRYAYCAYNPLRYTDPSGWLYLGASPSQESEFNRYRRYANASMTEEQWANLGINREILATIRLGVSLEMTPFMMGEVRKGGFVSSICVRQADNGLGGTGGWVSINQKIQYDSKATSATLNWLGATLCQDNVYYGLFGSMYDLTTEEGRFGKAVDEAIIESVEDARNQDPFDVYVGQPSTSDFSKVATYISKNKYTGFATDNIHRGYNYNGGQGILAVCDNDRAMQLYFEGWTTATNTPNGNPVPIRSFSQSSSVAFENGFPIYFKYNDRAAAVVIFRSMKDVNRIYDSFRRTFGF